MKKIILLSVLFTSAVFLNAQDFGFGSIDEEDAGTANNAINVTVGGEVSAEFVGYIDDFSSRADNVQLGDIFSGALNFSAKTSVADGIINLNIRPEEQPVSIDEAYVRAYFGSLEIEGGIRKLTWGKADSFGPLDVINPLDYSELTDLSDMMNLKIARPLIHASYRIGSFSKIEGVFVPSFVPLRYADEGRWVPSEIKLMKNLRQVIEQEFQNKFQEMGITNFQYSYDENKPDSDDLLTLKYLQAGARFTTTIGQADIGLQYYYGRLTRPAVSVTSTINYTQIPIPPYSFPSEVHSSVCYAYNPYHQIGVDWAQVLFGFNVRAEFAANITEDLNGEDGSVYNPSLAWSFGFDRDLFLGVNLNIQCNESIRLMHDKIGKNPLVVDTEADTNMTSTQIIAALSKKFLRDELELRFAALLEIEDKDYLLMPAIIWTRDAVSVELSGGIFGGNEDGQFGQYKNNTFIKAALTYSF
jgi:hypothetical protein